jgi:IS30 family transposase
MAAGAGTAPQLRIARRGIEPLRPKVCKLARHDELRQLVAARLSENWSPEQIAGWLKHTYPGDEAHQVSHETIYRSLFVQARGVLKKDLQAHLRSGRALRRSRHASSKSDARGSLTDMISIRERPASVEDRAVPDHWEGDLLCGSANSYIVTLVERHTRYVLHAKVANRDSRTVIADRPGEAATGRAPQVADLGPWQGDGAAQAVYAGDRCRSLLLRSRVLGSAARTRTPTACSGSTSPRAPTSAFTRRSGWTKSLGGLMDVHARLSGSKLQPSVLQPVLR